MDKYKHTMPITAIIENKGQFLFIKRSRYEKNMAGKWVFPGGKVEWGEDIIQALYRELVEETSLQFTNDFAFLSSYQFSRAEDNSSSQGLVFLVTSKNRNLKVDSSIEKYLWINPEDIADYTFSYKDINDFEKEDKVTIPGMEVHVRNAMIILKKGMLLNKNIFSVTEYQKLKCKMDKKYFYNLKATDNVVDFLENNNVFPNLEVNNGDKDF